jgi:hypothetical protein
MSDGELPLQAFIAWPAFKSARKHPEFLEALKKVYGDSFMLFESTEA